MADDIVAGDLVVPESCGCAIACEMHRIAPQMVEILSKIADAIGLFDDPVYQRRIDELLGRHEEAT